jgi:hypothetical protein
MSPLLSSLKKLSRQSRDILGGKNPLDSKALEAKARAHRVLEHVKHGDQRSVAMRGNGMALPERNMERGTSAARLDKHASLNMAEEQIETEIECGMVLPNKMTVERRMQLASPLPQCLVRPKPQPILKRIHDSDGEKMSD